MSTTTNGWVYFTCDRCDKLFRAQEVRDICGGCGSAQPFAPPRPER